MPVDRGLAHGNRFVRRQIVHDDDIAGLECRREHLLDIYGWFTEEFDTADLKEANGLFEELS